MTRIIFGKGEVLKVDDEVGDAVTRLREAGDYGLAEVTVVGPSGEKAKYYVNRLQVQFVSPG